MFKNYLKIAVRNLKIQKVYSFINILGLAVGLACFFLILLWVEHERSYDRFHENFDNIYRVNKIWRKGEVAHYATTPAPLADALKRDYPEIVNSTRIISFTQALFKYEDKLIRENMGYVADENFLDIFTFPFLYGDPATALSNPNSVIITENLSHKLFGSEEPIGKIIAISGQQDIMVTGVIKDIPATSHLQFTFIFPYNAISKEMQSDWHNTIFYNYLLLDQETDRQALSEKISNFLKTPIPESTSSLYLQPLKKIHLYSSNLRMSLPTSGNILYVVVFTLLAVFILLIAVINFVNLTTARSGNRAREVGLRKVVGAQRIGLIKQFLGESTLMTLFALILAIVIIYLFLPTLSNLAGTQLSITLRSNQSIFFMVFGITLLTGILSGIYPALFLSSLKPVKALKESSKMGFKTFSFRKR